MKQHEEMIRLINETPLRYLQENDAAIARFREFTESFATNRLLQAIDNTAIAKISTALDVDKMLPDPSKIAELTKSVFGGLTGLDSIKEMERYANQHREIS